MHLPVFHETLTLRTISLRKAVDQWKTGTRSRKCIGMTCLQEVFIADLLMVQAAAWVASVSELAEETRYDKRLKRCVGGSVVNCSVAIGQSE